MNTTELNNIVIHVKTTFLDADSSPTDERYVYAYTIDIENKCAEPVQLISRFWCITDGNNSEQEVRGLGVVGQQPRLAPGQRYRYTSGAVLNTSSGMMRGHYVFEKEDGTQFEAEIPAFALVQSSALH